MLATEKGKKHALAELKLRREKNSKVEKIDNSRLPAGTSMYFYCVSCGGPADVLPESYVRQPKKLCDECDALQLLGWLE